MTDRELMQQALDTLDCIYSPLHEREINKVAAAMTALRERLAQTEQPKMRTGDCLLTGVCASEGHKIQKARPDQHWIDELAKVPDHVWAQPKQEPVAHVDHRIHGWPDCFVMEAEPPHTTPLYTTPPQRKPWVGLTDAELAEFSEAKLGTYDLCLEVEAKLKDKNAWAT